MEIIIKPLNKQSFTINKPHTIYSMFGEDDIIEEYCVLIRIKNDDKNLKTILENAIDYVFSGRDYYDILTSRYYKDGEEYVFLLYFNLFNEKKI